jgi:Na+/H+-translocating membrane pyrophosphatase
VPRIKR